VVQIIRNFSGSTADNKNRVTKKENLFLGGKMKCAGEIITNIGSVGTNHDRNPDIFQNTEPVVFENDFFLMATELILQRD